MAHSASVLLPTTPERCWQAFTDVSLLPAWVPGLRRARVVRAGAQGLPLEVAFEFGATLTYSLTYEYDPASHIVTWQPRIGRRDGVAGSARFEAEGAGCRFTYESQPGPNASRERQEDDPQRVVDAFASWLARQDAR